MTAKTITELRRAKIVTDGTVAGTTITDTDTGEPILAEKVTFELSTEEGVSRAVVYAIGAALEYEGEINYVQPLGDDGPRKVTLT